MSVQILQLIKGATMGYPPSKIDQANTAMFQSVHKKTGPAGLVSFLSLMLTLLCVLGVIIVGSVSVQQLFTGEVPDAVAWVPLILLGGAIFLLISLISAIIGAVEGSGWAAATITVIFLPVIAGLFLTIGTVGSALFGLLLAV